MEEPIPAGSAFALPAKWLRALLMGARDSAARMFSYRSRYFYIAGIKLPPPHFQK
jgi:hypothetical protein